MLLVKVLPDDTLGGTRLATLDGVTLGGAVEIVMVTEVVEQEER